MIVIALLAIVRKIIILDLSSTGAAELFALAAAILALGAVYWLVQSADTNRPHRNSRSRRFGFPGVRLCHADGGRPQQAIVMHIPGLQDFDHGSRSRAGVATSKTAS